MPVLKIRINFLQMAFTTSVHIESTRKSKLKFEERVDLDMLFKILEQSYLTKSRIFWYMLSRAESEFREV